MDWMKLDLVGLLYQLLPGFVAAWVFYGLTPNKVSQPFERIVQALIFSALVRAAVIPTGWWWLHRHAGATWSQSADIFASVMWAFIVGLLVTLFANKDWLHSLLRKLTLTKKTSYPSEWFSALKRHRSYVVLHLDGERRIRGWPEEFPDQADTGHFVLEKPTWLDEIGTEFAMPQISRMIIPVSQVSFVEILKNAAALDMDAIRLEQQPLIDLHIKKEIPDGRKCSPTDSTPTPN